jgi:hypothetical protein
MKVELKQLAPYLPYGLKIQVCDKTSTLDGLHINSIELMPPIHGFRYPSFGQIKPILRHISDLKQSELLEIVNHIFRDSKGIMPKQDSVKVDKGYITFHDLNTMQNYVCVKPSSDGTPLLNMRNCFNDYQIFFKLHVDMFNLIEQGLAIDINTLSHV